MRSLLPLLFPCRLHPCPCRLLLKRHWEVGKGYRGWTLGCDALFLSFPASCWLAPYWKSPTYGCHIIYSSLLFFDFNLRTRDVWWVSECTFLRVWVERDQTCPRTPNSTPVTAACTQGRMTQGCLSCRFTSSNVLRDDCCLVKCGEHNELWLNQDNFVLSNIFVALILHICAVASCCEDPVKAEMGPTGQPWKS